MIAKLLITGASGLLGSNLALELSPEHDVYGLVHSHPMQTDRFEVLRGDLLEKDVLVRVIDETSPDAIIHCAGKTKIDPCEEDPERAYQLNARVPGRIADNASSGIKLLHVSTAAVFSGRQGQYTESDEPDPLSVYAETILAGEQNVLQKDPQAIVARISIFGWSPSGTRSLAEYFFNQLSAGKEITGFADVDFCPLLVNHLAPIFLTMTELECQGVYHVTGSDCVSKYELGCRIADQFGLDRDLIRRGSVEDASFLG